MPIYLRPETIEGAVAALAQRPLLVIAGGTDFYPPRVGRTVAEDILDVTAIATLRGISDFGTHWRIGATTTWSDVVEQKLPAMFDGLKLAGQEVGGRQIQNAGTIAGNICNASPAADGVPALLVLDASLVLASARGTRSVRLADFVRGNRRTALAADEIVVAIDVPAPSARAVSHFIKLGARKYLVISITMAAGVLEIDSGRVAAARIAIGACSEVAQRLPRLEQALLGRRIERFLKEIVDRSHVEDLRPIDDVRASAAYRLEAAEIVLRRLMSALITMAGDTNQNG